MADLTPGAEVRRMWPAGPLRQFRDIRAKNNSGWTVYYSTILKGYAGSYVCEQCLSPTPGVYRLPRSENGQSDASCVCAGCRERVKPKKHHPARQTRVSSVPTDATPHR